MAVRVQFLTFQKDDLKSLIENTYSKVRERILKSAEENIDDWDIETIEFLENNKHLKNLVEFKEEDISRIISSFFGFLEMGKSKVKHKYYQSSISLRKYKDDFKIIEQYGSNNLQKYFKFLIEGRSLKNEKRNFQQIKSQPDFKIGFLSKKERDFIIEEIESKFGQIINGTSIENLIIEFKEIGINYQQVIILIS